MKSTANQKSNILADLGPLYHDFSFLGVDNEQVNDHYIQNQKAKGPIITAYISHAIAKCELKNGLESPSFTELFCADGYYTMLAARLGCSPTYGIDNNSEKHLEKAPIISSRIGLEECNFICSDITELSTFEQTDIVANIGGLYHVNNPKEILRNSFVLARQFLIVQSVVSMATNDDFYYEKPAPGWTWGSRYSRSSFHKMLTEICPNIIDYHFNELTGNTRPEDRGSVYYLIKK